MRVGRRKHFDKDVAKIVAQAERMSTTTYADLIRRYGEPVSRKPDPKGQYDRQVTLLKFKCGCHADDVHRSGSVARGVRTRALPARCA